MDAHTFSVTNFVWKNDSDKESPEVSIQFHEAKDFEPDLEVQKLVNSFIECPRGINVNRGVLVIAYVANTKHRVIRSM